MPSVTQPTHVRGASDGVNIALMPNYSLVGADASDAEAILACADAAYAKNLLTIATYPEDRQNLTSPDELHA